MTPLERAQEAKRLVREAVKEIVFAGDAVPEHLEEAEDHLNVLISQLSPQPKRAG